MKPLRHLIAILMIAAPLVSAASDRTIEEKIAARLGLMKSVAHSKWITGRVIEDTDREKIVIEQAVISGLQYGITTSSTTSFFRAQIEAAKAIQRYWFRAWKGEYPIAEAPSLTELFDPSY